MGIYWQQEMCECVTLVASLVLNLLVPCFLKSLGVHSHSPHTKVRARLVDTLDRMAYHRCERGIALALFLNFFPRSCPLPSVIGYLFLRLPGLSALRTFCKSPQSGRMLVHLPCASYNRKISWRSFLSKTNGAIILQLTTFEGCIHYDSVTTATLLVLKVRILQVIEANIELSFKNAIPLSEHSHNTSRHQSHPYQS